MAKEQTIRFEGEFNLFVKMVKLVKENTLSVVLTLALLFVSAVGVIKIQQLQVQQDKIAESVAPDETGAVLKKFESDKNIDRILTELRQKFNADRAKLFQYHNSISSVGGVKFLYISATNEVRNLGISSEISNLQRLPSSLFNATIARYLENSDTVCVQRERVIDTAGKQLLENQGIQISCNYPVFLNGDIVGIITLNFNSEKVLDEKALKQELQFTAIRTGDALGHQ